MRKFIVCSLMTPLLQNITLAADDAGRISDSDNYFSCGYINYAWGFVSNGFYINTKGEVYKYERRKLVGLELADEELVGQIDLEELNEKVILIAPASKGEVIRKQVAQDAGTKSCSAYISDISSGENLIVNLGTYDISDFEHKNTSKEAQDLLNWLMDVKKKYIQPHNKRMEQTLDKP